MGEKDVELSKREKESLKLENSGGSDSRKAVITGRHLKGEIRKIAEGTKKK